MTRLAIICSMVFAGCGSVCPTVKETRCSGSVVEVCGSNKKWQKVMDCSQVKAIKKYASKSWSCSEVLGKGCICVPERTN